MSRIGALLAIAGLAAYAADGKSTVPADVPKRISRNPRDVVDHFSVRSGAFYSSEDKFIGVKRRQRTSKRARAKAHAKCIAWRGKP